MPLISPEIERLERYAAYLDDRRLSAAERAEIARQLNFLIGNHSSADGARRRFLPFVRQMWPGFIHGSHHDIMADVFERIERGQCGRAIINMPPRSTKSRFASVLFQAWYLGRNPDRQVMACSHTASLALDFGRDVRNLIHSPEYQQIFPGVGLSQDARAAYRWNTNKGGRYFAVGKTGAAAGRGGVLVIIDDPHSEQDVLANPKAEFEKTWKWYLAGPRQRLQPKASILVVMTRWGPMDLTGQLHKQAIQDADGEQWEVVELPAILPSGNALFPQYWELAELERTRATLPAPRWLANYQQTPTTEEGSLIQREWWRDWPDHEYAPPCEIKVMAWDTAYSAKSSADRSAMVLWGTFSQRDAQGALFPGIVLLDAWAERVDFPDLKRKALEFQQKWRPDYLLIENRATGTPLMQELARIGVFSQEANPNRTNDKYMRVNAVADLFKSGLVWAPLGKVWVEEVREEMATFPYGSNDDLLDAAVYGLLRIRQGGLMRLPSDEEEEEWKPRRHAGYY
jgi:predicted phage terminase large subunit-like protein